MKIHFLFSLLFLVYGSVFAQSAKTKYPDPEFSNEIYLLKKDSTLLRLEKDASAMDTKLKAAGFGGAESGYSIEGEKSQVQIQSGEGLSFIFSTSASAPGSSATSDSMARAMGADPAMMAETMSDRLDPGNTISLYKTEPGKEVRKILLQKTPGMLGINKKLASAKKYTFSVKKIREGYWELVIDKTLPKGEYAFTITGMATENMLGSVSIFAFGVN